MKKCAWNAKKHEQALNMKFSKGPLRHYKELERWPLNIDELNIEQLQDLHTLLHNNQAVAVALDGATTNLLGRPVTQEDLVELHLAVLARADQLGIRHDHHDVLDQMTGYVLNAERAAAQSYQEARPELSHESISGFESIKIARRGLAERGLLVGHGTIGRPPRGRRRRRRRRLRSSEAMGRIRFSEEVSLTADSPDIELELAMVWLSQKTPNPEAVAALEDNDVFRAHDIAHALWRAHESGHPGARDVDIVRFHRDVVERASELEPPLEHVDQDGLDQLSSGGGEMPVEMPKMTVGRLGCSYAPEAEIERLAQSTPDQAFDAALSRDQDRLVVGRYFEGQRPELVKSLNGLLGEGPAPLLDDTVAISPVFDGAKPVFLCIADQITSIISAQGQPLFEETELMLTDLQSWSFENGIRSGIFECQLMGEGSSQILSIQDVLYLDEQDVHAEPLTQRLDRLSHLRFQQRTADPRPERGRINLVPVSMSSARRGAEEILEGLRNNRRALAALIRPLQNGYELGGSGGSAMVYLETLPEQDDELPEEAKDSPLVFLPSCVLEQVRLTRRE